MLPLFKHGAYCRPLKNGACCPPFNVVHAALLSRMVHVVLVNSCKGTTFTSLQCLASSIKLSQGAGTHPEHNRRVPCSCPCLCSALTWQMRADVQHAALAILCSQQLWCIVNCKFGLCSQSAAFCIALILSPYPLQRLRNCRCKKGTKAAPARNSSNDSCTCLRRVGAAGVEENTVQVR